MKYNKKDAVKYLISVLTLVICVFGMEMIYNNLPKAITYDSRELPKEKSVSSKNFVVESTVPCPYKTAAEITQDGSFTIKSIKNDIYVMQEDICLCRLSCTLSDFPENDKKAIETGIEIRNKDELLEIVSYLES